MPSTTTVPTSTTSSLPSVPSPTRRHALRRATLGSGAVAAVSTTAVAAGAHAAGVPLEIDGEMIPLIGFAQMTLIGAVLGGLLAGALNRYSAEPRRRFVPAAIVLTALSSIPSVTMPPDLATKMVLVATHVIAALVIVPALARRTRA
jgi:hypothetical protein